MLTLFFVKHFDRTGVTLLNVGLHDLRDRLALRDVVADGDADRRQSSGRGGSRFDDAAAAADQNSFAGGAGGDPPDDAPNQRGDEGDADDEDQDPVKRPGNTDEVVELLRRCGALQCHGTKCPLRQVGHLPRSFGEPRTLPPVASHRWFGR